MRKKHSKTKKTIGTIKFILIIVLFIVIGCFIYRESQKTVICIDPGHGGKDVRLCIE